MNIIYQDLDQLRALEKEFDVSPHMRDFAFKLHFPTARAIMLGVGSGEMKVVLWPIPEKGMALIGSGESANKICQAIHARIVEIERSLKPVASPQSTGGRL